MGFFDRAFNPGEMRIAHIRRKDIEKSNYKELVRGIRYCRAQGMRGLEKLLISVEGYEEQCFENSDVRDYFTHVVDKFPYLFLLVADYHQNKMLLSLLVGEYTYATDNSAEVDVVIPAMLSKIIIRNCVAHIGKSFVDEDDMWRILRKYPFEYEMPDPDEELRLANAEKDATAEIRDGE